MCDDMMKVKHNQDQRKKSLCNDTMKVSIHTITIGEGKRSFQGKRKTRGKSPQIE